MDIPTRPLDIVPAISGILHPKTSADAPQLPQLSLDILGRDSNQDRGGERTTEHVDMTAPPGRRPATEVAARDEIATVEVTTDVSAEVVEGTDESKEAEQPAPPFVPARAVLERFDLLPGNFSRMRPELFALSLGGKTYRFPKSYLEAYSNWLGDTKANPRNAGDFAATSEARSAIETAQQGFTEALGRLAISQYAVGDTVYAIDFAELVGVGEQTVDDWRRAGLPVHTPLEWRAHRRIAMTILDRFCSWRYPASFPQEESGRHQRRV